MTTKELIAIVERMDSVAEVQNFYKCLPMNDYDEKQKHAIKAVILTRCTTLRTEASERAYTFPVDEIVPQKQFWLRIIISILLFAGIVVITFVLAWVSLKK